MNVNDTTSPEATKDMLEMIFDRQQELMEKYIEIENRSGIGKGILNGEPFDIDRPRSQAVCKDFAWRITEEITEAMEAFELSKEEMGRFHSSSNDEKYKSSAMESILHTKEECIDALHFLVELYLIVGITPSNLLGDSGNKLENAFKASMMKRPADPYQPIHYLGLAMNCLKQKPWKQTHMNTDTRKFKLLLVTVFFEWVTFAKSLGLTAESTFDLYFRKSEVNKFRQGSNY